MSHSTEPRRWRSTGASCGSVWRWRSARGAAFLPPRNSVDHRWLAEHRRCRGVELEAEGPIGEQVRGDPTQQADFDHVRLALPVCAAVEVAEVLRADIGMLPV